MFLISIDTITECNYTVPPIIASVGCERYVWKYLVISGTAGIDNGINTVASKAVSIPKISIMLRYRKVLIPELGIEIRYLVREFGRVRIVEGTGCYWRGLRGSGSNTGRNKK